MVSSMIIIYLACFSYYIRIIYEYDNYYDSIIIKSMVYYFYIYYLY